MGWFAASQCPRQPCTECCSLLSSHSPQAHSNANASTCCSCWPSTSSHARSANSPAAEELAPKYGARPANLLSLWGADGSKGRARSDCLANSAFFSPAQRKRVLRFKEGAQQANAGVGSNVVFFPAAARSGGGVRLTWGRSVTFGGVSWRTRSESDRYGWW